MSICDEPRQVGPGPVRQIASGIDLIVLSRLASWTGTTLVPISAKAAFDAHWVKLDRRLGRWLCWIAFGVGSESIVTGARQHKGKSGNWDASISWEKFFQMKPDVCTEVTSAVACLSKIRNRDAHQYLPDCRDDDFPLVESKFIPALNCILEHLGEDIVEQVDHVYQANNSLIVCT